MIITAVVAIALGWLGKRIERKRDEREPVEILVKLGGTVSYDYEKLNGATPPGPDWLRNLLGENFFSEVVGVSFHVGTKVTDAGLVSLKRLTQLQTLDVFDGDVTDDGLKHLTGLSHLQTLNLSRTQVTDAGLKDLKALTQLQTLDLSDTQVTNAGLEDIKGLSQLQTLYLEGTKVSDVGVGDLQRVLPSCRIIVTNVGVEDLQKALPNCVIND
jgi:hypothetical protein